MDKYKVMADFNSTGIKSLTDPIVSAMPLFWPILLLFFWMFLSAASYYVILKTTGKKRFWHSTTAVSFVFFIISLILSSINTIELVYLSGYWVAFYIIMTLVSWKLLSNYK